MRNGVKTPRDGDGPHDETTVSEVSGDITLDSIRDHIVREGSRTPDLTMSSMETTVVERDLGPGRSETVETVSRTVETINVVTSSSIVPGVVTSNGVAAS